MALADDLAGEGSFADKLRKRRQDFEGGDPEGLHETKSWKDLSVDGVVDNEKTTYEDDVRPREPRKPGYNPVRK